MFDQKMEDSYFDSLPSPEELDAETWAEVTRLIGEYVVSFQAIEGTLKDAIVTLLGCDEISGDIVCAELGFRGVLQVFMSLMLHRLNEERSPEALCLLQKRIETASKKRNTIVHSVWIKNGLTSNGVLTFKPTSSLRNGYGGGYLEKTLREMYSDVEEFKELDSDLLCWINAIVTSERSE